MIIHDGGLSPGAEEAGLAAQDKRAGLPSIQMRRLSAADGRNGKGAAMYRVLTQSMLLVPGPGQGRLSYDMMTKLALAAAEEHVARGSPLESSGIVTLYAKVASHCVNHA